MTDRQHLPRRRDVLRTGAAAGLVAVTGWTVGGATAQDDPDPTQSTYSYSLVEGVVFRVRYKPRDPAGNPATDVVPEECLDGMEEDFHVLIVEAYRDGEFNGYRGVLSPLERIESELVEDGDGTTTPEETPEDETETPETTTVGAAEFPELRAGQWYEITSSEECGDLNRLVLETTQAPEPAEGETETPGETPETETETTEE